MQILLLLLYELESKKGYDCHKKLMMIINLNYMSFNGFLSFEFDIL